MQESFNTVKQLVEDFKAQEAAYLSPTYQESRVRTDFIDKFFTALGWDVTHERQKNPYEQEVKIENNVTVSGSQRRADYAFSIAPNFRTVKFFVEAKKPSRNLANADDYYQTIRYGWNTGTPLAVLTDFEEFHIIDCRYKPDIKSSLDRKIELFHYSDYANEETFARIIHLFGREAVANGSLEKFVAALPKTKGKTKKGAIPAIYQQVDESFLELLDGYREHLAREFKNKNQHLDGEELTEAVQRTLDRLVFIRFLEDKSIEEPSIIGLSAKPSAWKAFTSLCRGFEPKYNGLVFKQHRVIDGETFIPPDDTVFGEICDELSDPASPYDFDKIPISILGSIYERFLGKVVRATGKRAKVEEKPEVRKAGGVYYTPEYIVRYIVNETVGKLLYETLTPSLAPSEQGSDQKIKKDDVIPERFNRESRDQQNTGLPIKTFGSDSEGHKVCKRTPVEIAKMAFADIACGSGSFLLEVYGTLLDYHTRWYNEHPDKAKKGDVETRDGKLVLSLKKRQEILTNNIYGVDIDAQAYEVTQVSLYLKLLEEATMSEGFQFSLLKEKLLPDLKANIVCGNSLIGTDIEAQSSLFDNTVRVQYIEPQPSIESQLKPMNFADAFPEIMCRGGFDAIVGNPPYIRIQAMTEFNPLQVELLKKRYKTAGKGNYDIYVVFVERALSSLNNKGQLGYILPHKFFNAQYGEPLRDLIAKGKHLSHVVHFGDQQVFDGATTYTCLLFLQSSTIKEVKFVKVDNLDAWRETGKAVEGTIPIANVTEKEWNFTVGESGGLFEKLRSMPVKLGDLADRIFQGLVTGADPVFIVENENGKTFYSENTDRSHKLETNLLHPLCKGSVNIRRYMISEITKSILFPYKLVDGKAELLSAKELSSDYPQVWEYLKENRSRLESREHGKWKNSRWYAFGRSQNLGEMEQKKILTPSIANRASFTLDSSNAYYFVGSGGGGGGGYGITLKASELLSYEYVLGLLNSKLLDLFLKSLSTSFSGGYYAYNRQYIEQLPIRTINFTDPADKSCHDQIVTLVEQMLAAKEKLASAKTDAEQNRLDMQCAALDRQIDAAVYELYGLTEEEIKIVEGK